MGDDRRDEADVARTAMNKAMLRIVPFLLLAYIMAYIDRVNVSFAALQMNADLGFSATVYGLGGGLFFVGYALFEIPSGAMASRFGPRRWLARIMITWGLLAVGMMFIQTANQFYLMRFLLGAQNGQTKIYGRPSLIGSARWLMVVGRPQHGQKSSVVAA